MPALCEGEHMKDRLILTGECSFRRSVFCFYHFTGSRQVRRVHCTTLLYNLLPLLPSPHIVDTVLDSDGKDTCHPVCQYRGGHYTGRGVLSNMYAV